MTLAVEAPYKPNQSINQTFVDNPIRALQPTMISLAYNNIILRHCLIFAMIDRKICNAVTTTKFTQNCYLCGATSKQVNDIEKVLNMEVHSSHLKFGIPVLRTWIRCF